MNVNKLPANMMAKIAATDCPVVGLRGKCWVWTGCKNSKGYGCVSIGGKVQLAHRVSYALHVGEIPTDRQIDHLCRNKQCCNPRHLEAVTGKVNAERTHEATKPRCMHGHPLAGVNVRTKRKPSGLTQRQCVACEVIQGNARTAKARRGVRPVSAAWTAKREARVSALIADGEAALEAWEQQQTTGGAA